MTDTQAKASSDAERLAEIRKYVKRADTDTRDYQFADIILLLNQIDERDKVIQELCIAIRRRLASDDVCNHPYDEDLGTAIASAKERGYVK